MCCRGRSECWQLLTRCPRTQASQAHFSPLMSMAGLDRPMTLRFADGCCEMKEEGRGVSGKIGSATPPISGVPRVSARAGLLGEMQLTTRCRSFGGRYCGSSWNSKCDLGTMTALRALETPAGCPSEEALVLENVAAAMTETSKRFQYVLQKHRNS
jgi:hypothetical protein